MLGFIDWGFPSQRIFPLHFRNPNCQCQCQSQSHADCQIQSNCDTDRQAGSFNKSGPDSDLAAN
jgi:hypothetical protein